jgi:hypothetical protein
MIKPCNDKRRTMEEIANAEMQESAGETYWLPFSWLKMQITS